MVGIVGCGNVVLRGHLPAYAKEGFAVAGVFDLDPAAAAATGERAYASLDELLADPAVSIVDVATPPEPRPELVRRALEAGKHVLAQKPLALDLARAIELVELADTLCLRLAVNQNARWAPPWRIATEVVRSGGVGDVFAVTHLLDKRFDFAAETPHLDAMEHFLLFDYCVHWFDISRCWLDGKSPLSVAARELRSPGQPPGSRAPWGGHAVVEYADGSTAVIRSTGGSAGAPACPFWIHGTAGTIRGSILHGSDFVELDSDGRVTRFRLDGEWWPDGFGGAMRELVQSIGEGREPYNSARHNLLSLELTLAACASAERGGQPVSVGKTERANARSRATSSGGPGGVSSTTQPS